MMKSVEGKLNIFWFLKHKTTIILIISIVIINNKYGLPFWGGTYKDYLAPLNTTINGLIKVIISKPYLYSTNQLYYIDFDVQRLSSLYYKSLLLLVYKYKYCLNTIEHN